jgi:acyl carrier protein
MESIVSSSIESVILDTLRSMAREPDEVGLDVTLEALDIDSLDLVELTHIVDDEQDFALSPNELRGVETVRDVVDRYLAAAA